MANIFDYLLKGIIPIIIGAVVLYGIVAKVKVYECFVEGAKEGINVCVRIFPYLLAMLIAVNCFRASGAMNYFIDFIKLLIYLSSMLIKSIKYIYKSLSVLLK